MTLRIGVYATNFGTPLNKDTLISSEFLMKESGNNIGNWAFWHATSKLLDAELSIISGNPKTKDYKDKIDIIAIPAANWLQPRYDFAWLADFIEEMDKPCIMIGLGAQAHNNNHIPDLSEGTIRMLKAVSARTPYIGVRGDYTYKVCKSYNIDNIKVMGCPSLFINSSPSLGQSIAKRWPQHTKGKTVIHATMFHNNVKHVEQWLFDYLSNNDNSSYIIQAPRAFLKPLFQETFHKTEIDFIEKYKNNFKEGVSTENFLSTLHAKSYSPPSVTAWINYINLFSRSIGTRIHGSVLSLSATVPTVCITHDSRTEELCNVMQVPSISCKVLTKENTIDEVFDQVDFDASAFNENRRYRAKQYKELFDEAGIISSKHLTDVIQSSERAK